MKVVRFKKDNVFNSIGVKIERMFEIYKYGVVNDTYNYGEVVFNGTKKKCIEFIENLKTDL